VSFSGQSGPLLQAGLLGKRIVASDVGVIAESVAEYHLGRLFEPGNASSCAREIEIIASEAEPDGPAVDRLAEEHSTSSFVSSIVQAYAGI
jgi:hypothetical protein